MTLRDLLPTIEQFTLVKGVERELLTRRRTSAIAGLIAAVALALQFVALLPKDSTYLHDLGELVLNPAASIHDFKYRAELAGLLVVIASLSIYLLARRTGFLFKQSAEPFRYTFWIDDFRPATAVAPLDPGAAARLQLLHHDLMERLSQRINRLSLLNVDALKDQPGSASHIQVGGFYAIRERRTDEWVLHVMPQVRIGLAGQPTTLTHPVEYALTKAGDKLDADRYNQLVERVYSRIATEIYRRLESDVKEKLYLFPTAYLRAAALSCEAEDLARSNTVDAYERAIDMYRQALSYFRVTLLGPIADALAYLPFVWRMVIGFQHLRARVQVGFAKCLVYRRVISTLSGRERNPLFEGRTELSAALDSLAVIQPHLTGRRWPDATAHARFASLKTYLTFPRDTWWRLLPKQALYSQHTKIEFDAHVVAALTYYYLDAFAKAKRELEDARAVGPALSEHDPLYALAEGEIEPDVDLEIPMFRRATEIAPDFEIAQYQLAYSMDMRFRGSGDLVRQRARRVIDEYDSVLRINPGNVAAHAQQGYLSWLTGDLDGAKAKFRDGYEIKAIARDTFVGVLSHGLARIAAEQGEFARSSDLYAEAVSSDPDIATYSPPGPLPYSQYFEYITPAILARYRGFCSNVDRAAKRRTAAGKSGHRRKRSTQVSLATVKSVQGWVRNDYGNACLNYFLRMADREALDLAIQAFEKARELDPKNALVLYNLHWAYSNRAQIQENRTDAERDAEKARRRIERSAALLPAWPTGALALALSRLQAGQSNVQAHLNQARAKLEEESALRERANAMLEAVPINAAAMDAARDQRRPSGGTLTGAQQDRSDTQAQSRQRTPEQARQEATAAMQLALDEIRAMSDDASPNLRVIFRPTKLWPLSEDMDKDWIVGGVKKLLRGTIVADRLDDPDVLALGAWIRVLVYRPDNEANDAAELLAGYIDREYTPDDFTISVDLREMYDRQFTFASLLEGYGKPESDEARTEKNKKLQDRIAPTVQTWLDRDPVNYVALTWANRITDLVQFEKVLDRALDRAQPLRPWYQARIGDLFYDFGTESFIAKALAMFDEARALGGATPEYAARCAKAENRLGEFLFERRDFEKSELRFRAAVQKKEDVAEYHANLGNALVALERNDEAEESYKSAIEREPRNADWHNLLGNLYYDILQDYPKSLSPYKTAIEIAPERAVFQYNCAGALVRVGEWLEAERLYQKAIELEPKTAIIRHGYGFSLGLQREFGRAVVQLRKAIELDRSVPVYRRHLVECLELNGDTAAALAAAEEAVRSFPSDEELARTLAELRHPLTSAAPTNTAETSGKSPTATSSAGGP
jgi:tetratricopeptide (TPR) repeat protein